MNGLLSPQVVVGPAGGHCEAEGGYEVFCYSVAEDMWAGWRQEAARSTAGGWELGDNTALSPQTPSRVGQRGHSCSSEPRSPLS